MPFSDFYLIFLIDFFMNFYSKIAKKGGYFGPQAPYADVARR